MTRKTLVISLIPALCALFFMRAAPAEVVYIPDADLRAAILKKLNKPNPKAAITKADMLQLTELRLEDVNFSTLMGLEHATNLTTLYLSWDDAVSPMQRSDHTSDVSPLTNLTQLKTLVLDGSNIRDVSPLAQLTQLTELRLTFSNIRDVSPLAKLKNLRVLDLHNYRYDNDRSVDMSPLAHLTQLTELNLTGNGISDVSWLTGLMNLTTLNLTYNAIVDVSPLTGLTNLTVLDLSNNNIVDVAPLTSLMNLPQLDLSSNDIVDVSPLAKLTQLIELRHRLHKPDRAGPEWQPHRRCLATRKIDTT